MMIVLHTTILLLLASVALSHDCMHDEIIKSLGEGHELPQAEVKYKYEEPLPHDYHHHDHEHGDGHFELNEHQHAGPTIRRLQANGNFESIRIVLDFSRFDEPGEAAYMCLPGGSSSGQTVSFSSDTSSTFSCNAADEFTATKRTFLQNTLLVDSADWWMSTLSVNPVVGNLILSNGNNCVNTAYVCCNNQIPASHKTVGIPNADYIFYITARPTGTSTLAWALTCQTDSNGRPIAGHINFSPAALRTAIRDRPRQFSTALHEMAHALAFSSSLYSRYRNSATGQAWGYSNVVGSGSVNGKSVTKIITPTVVAKAKEHFDCLSLNGIELEEFGGSGSAGSHWEKRLVNNEFMTATISMSPVRSALTLALFEDTGWYSVNFAYAQNLAWGNGKGCNFANLKCDTWSSDYFCRTSQELGCTQDRTAKAYCDKFTFNSDTIPSQFQYFGSPRIGGQSGYIDFCSHYRGRSNGDCRNLGYSATSVSSSIKEKLGDSSRCFMANGVPACYPTQCTTAGVLQIEVGGVIDTCPPNGGTKTVNGLSVVCPPSAEICSLQEFFCNNGFGCSGFGTCESDGVCDCISGRTGPGCDLLVCPKAPDGSECNSIDTTSICDSSLGVCTCENGYAGDACDELLCPESGGSPCSGNGFCDSNDGTCTCENFYTGIDCSNAPGCTKLPTDSCNTLSGGECDSFTGACACLQGFYGKDCTSTTIDTITPLEVFIGSDNLTYFQGTVDSKELRYFSAFVNSTTYDITVTVKTNSGDADFYAAYGDVLTQNIHPNTLEYTWSSTRHNSTQDDIVHICGSYEVLPRGSDDRRCTSRDLNFNFDGGTLVIAVLGFEFNETTEFQIAVERDACAAIGCGEHGYCDSGVCVCDPLWTGDRCDLADCPGTPDCFGRGICVAGNVTFSLPPNEFLPTGRRLTTSDDPHCECSFGFVDDDCSRLNPNFESPIEIFPHAGTRLDNTSAIISFPRQQGSTNWTYYQLDIPNDQQALFVSLNQQVSNAFCSSGAVTRPDEGCGKGDVMLLAQRSQLPLLSDYAAFDAMSWSVASNSHRILLDGTTGLVAGRWYIGVYNSIYGRSRLYYDLTVDATTRCAGDAATCSGHGACNPSGSLLEPLCACFTDYEGQFCANSVTPMAVDNGFFSTLVAGPSGEVLPSKWSYFSIDVQASDLVTGVQKNELTIELTSLASSDSIDSTCAINPELSECTLVSTDEFVSSFSELPLLLVSKTSTAPTLTSLGSIDYKALSMKKRKQKISLKAPTLVPGKYYIAIHNRHYASSPLKFNLTTSLAPIDPSSSEYLNCLPQSNTDVNATSCNGNGQCVQDDLIMKCNCFSGWSGEYCNTPFFGSIQALQSAVQYIDNICNTCSESISLARDEYQFFRIPQPLQANTGLKITVTASLQSSDADIIVFEQLPRSVYDFVSVSATVGNVESIILDKKSTSGRYWIAVFAKSPDEYQVQIEKVLVGDEGGSLTDLDFTGAFGDWLTGTTGGKVVLGMIVTIATVVFGTTLFFLFRQTSMFEGFGESFMSMFSFRASEEAAPLAQTVEVEGGSNARASVAMSSVAGDRTSLARSVMSSQS